MIIYVIIPYKVNLSLERSWGRRQNFVRHLTNKVFKPNWMILSNNNDESFILLTCIKTRPAM